MKGFSLVLSCAVFLVLCPSGMAGHYPVQVSPYAVRKLYTDVHVCSDLEYDSTCMVWQRNS